MPGSMDIHRCRFVDHTPETITSFSFSHESTTNHTPQDLRLAIGRSNGDIEIWNPRFNWIHDMTLPGGTNRSIEGLCWTKFGDDNLRLFSIGGSTSITEWDLATCKPLKNYDCNAGVIWSVSANKTGDKLAVGCDDGSVVIVDISGGPGSLEHESILQRQDSRILTLSWFKDELIISGCSDGRIRCWSCKGENKNRIIATMRVDKSKSESTLVWSIIILAEKRQIVSGDSTGSVKFWDLENFTLLQSYKVHDADVLCLSNDLNEEKVFSAGIDRKIFSFNYIPNNKSSKWVNSSNRLLHSNDIRAISSYESKNFNCLVSGGVERSVVINSVNNFHDGPYRKLPITKQSPNVIVNELKRLVVMWQNNTIKIWKVDSHGKGFKLVSKLILADEDNITTVDMSKNGELLAVGRLTSLKLFKLSEVTNSKKFKVMKFRDPQIDETVEGCSQLKFTSDDELIILTPEEDFLKLRLNPEESAIVSTEEIGLNNSKSINSTLSYINSIKTFTISPDKKTLAFSRFNGSIEVLSTDNSFKSYTLTRLSSTYPLVLNFSFDRTLLVLTVDNKLYEFNLKQEDQKSLLTSWSKLNSENLPHYLTNMKDECQGMFIKPDEPKKVWIYGSTWLCFIDLSIDLPPKISKVSKKRDRNGLSVNDHLESNEAEIDDDIDELENELDSEYNSEVRLNKLNKSKDFKNENSNINHHNRPFWLTMKYRPILSVQNFGDNEIIVIERPSFDLPNPTAFKVSHIKV